MNSWKNTASASTAWPTTSGLSRPSGPSPSPASAHPSDPRRGQDLRHDQTGLPPVGQRDRYERQRLSDGQGAPHPHGAHGQHRRAGRKRPLGAAQGDQAEVAPHRHGASRAPSSCPPKKRRASSAAAGTRFAPNCHPPTFWKSVITGEPYRVRGHLDRRLQPAGDRHPGAHHRAGAERPHGIHGGLRSVHDAHRPARRPRAARRPLAGAGRRGLHAQDMVRPRPKEARPGRGDAGRPGRDLRRGPPPGPSRGLPLAGPPCLSRLAPRGDGDELRGVQGKGHPLRRDALQEARGGRLPHPYGQVRVLLHRHGARGPPAPARLRRTAPVAGLHPRACRGISPHPHDRHQEA